jgi:hypothetical protein
MTLNPIRPFPQSLSDDSQSMIAQSSALDRLGGGH